MMKTTHCGWTIVSKGELSGGGGRQGEPDPISLPGPDTDCGLYSKNNWKSPKGNKQGDDLILSALYKKNFGCGMVNVLEGPY